MELHCYILTDDYIRPVSVSAVNTTAHKLIELGSQRVGTYQKTFRTIFTSMKMAVFWVAAPALMMKDL
jgi:hypothetical protein